MKTYFNFTEIFFIMLCFLYR